MKFIVSVIIICLFLYCSSEQVKTVRIIYTNDLAGRYDPKIVPWISQSAKVGGLAALSDFVAQQRKDDPSVIVLDAGNMIAGSALAFLTQGEAIVDIANTIGFDASNLGSDEFAYGAETLYKRTEEAHFPFLNANIFTRKIKDTLSYSPYQIFEKNGIQIAVIGIQGKKNFELGAAPYINFLYQAQDEDEILRKWINEIDKNVDIVIVLANQGFRGIRSSSSFVRHEQFLFKDKQMASKIEGIDVLIQGNSRIALKTPLVVGKTHIVSSGANGYFAGVLDLKVSVKSNKIIKSHNQLYPLLAGIHPPNLQTHERIETWRSQFTDVLSPTITHTNVPITRDFYRSSSLGNLVSDAVFNTIEGADFSMITSLNLEHDLPRGIVNYGDILAMLPMPSDVVQIHVPGYILREAFESAASLRYGILQVSGNVHSVLDYRKIPGEKIIELKIDGQVLDDTKIYKVNTTSFIAMGGGGFLPPTPQQAQDLVSKTLQDATADYLRGFQTYIPDPGSRITVINLPQREDSPHTYQSAQGNR